MECQRLLSAALVCCLPLSLASHALAATDTKVVSSSACQAIDPDQRPLLEQRQDGLFNVSTNQDVTVFCPLLIDSAEFSVGNVSGTSSVGNVDVAVYDRSSTRNVECRLMQQRRPSNDDIRPDWLTETLPAVASSGSSSSIKIISMDGDNPLGLGFTNTVWSLRCIIPRGDPALWVSGIRSIEYEEQYMSSTVGYDSKVMPSSACIPRYASDESYSSSGVPLKLSFYEYRSGWSPANVFDMWAMQNFSASGDLWVSCPTPRDEVADNPINMKAQGIDDSTSGSAECRARFVDGNLSSPMGYTYYSATRSSGDSFAGRFDLNVELLVSEDPDNRSAMSLECRLPRRSLGGTQAPRSALANYEYSEDK